MMLSFLYFFLSFLCVSTGCMDVLLIRMCRAYNPINNTLLFDGKFATAHLFKALGESTCSLSFSRGKQMYDHDKKKRMNSGFCIRITTQIGFLSWWPCFSSVFYLGCDDLVGSVFDFAKSLSRIQMSEEDMALFSAAVLLSPGNSLTK